MNCDVSETVSGPQSGQMFIDHVAKMRTPAPKERNVFHLTGRFAPAELSSLWRL
jgi:hypothetical protein